MSDLSIVLRDVDDLVPYANNAKKHESEQIDQIAASIKEFGFNNPILLDGENGVIAGHGRLLAAKKLKLIQVPTIELSHLTGAQKKAYILADNRLAEVNTSWDFDLLSLELESIQVDMDIELTGFDDSFILKEPGEGLTDEDETPELPEEPVTVLGDIWLMGEHRLMCGDSTDVISVEKLMNGENADMVFTDPPYGMFLSTDYDSMFGGDESHKKTGKRFDEVKGDHEDFNPEFINTVFSLFSRCKEIFLWGADYYVDLIPDRNKGSWVVWDKRCNDNMDKVVGNTFELCWSKAKHKRMVARILWSGHHGMAKDDTKSRVHPTQKPVELVTWFFDYYSLKDLNKVVDLFGGSGTTLIACEKAGKRCFMSEFEPKYVDVIVERWQNYTGQKATLESNGQTFDEMRTERSNASG